MKKQYSLYLDLENVEYLKSNGLDNVSEFINNLLKQEANLDPEKRNDIKQLKLANAKLGIELNKIIKERNLLTKALKEKEKKQEENKITFRSIGRVR